MMRRRGLADLTRLTVVRVRKRLERRLLNGECSRVRAALLVLSLAVSFGAGCSTEESRWADVLPSNHPLMETGNAAPFSEETAAVFLNADDLTFTWKRSHGPIMRSTISITGSGDAVAVVVALDEQGRYVMDGSDFVYGRSEVTVPPEEVRLLRQLIASKEFQTMPREFHSRLQDGLSIRCIVTAGGLRKEVFCDSYFPKPIRKIAAFLQTVVGSV